MKLYSFFETMNTSEFLYKFRFIADFAAIGILCFMAIMTLVVIYLTSDIINEIDEMKDVFMDKKATFEVSVIIH